MGAEGGGRPGFPENELAEFLGVHGRGASKIKQGLMQKLKIL